MKIGVDIRVLGENKYGGISEYIKNILPLLLKNKEHSFYLFYSSFSNKAVEIEKILNIKESKNIKIYKFCYPNKLLFFASYFNTLKFDKIMKVKNLDLFFSPHILPVSLSNNIPRITVVHDISFKNYPEFFDTKRKLWHFTVNPKKQIEKSSAIITPSGYIKNEIIEKYKINPEKIKAIHLSVKKDKNHKYYTKKELQEKYKIPQNYILTLSAIEPRKNIIGLIHAFNIACENKKMENINLVIAGGMGWKYQKTLKEYKKSKHKERIIFTGPIEERYKKSIYRNAILFVFPSFYEGFGLPPLEAMAESVPVISSFSGSLPEVVGNSAILTDPYNSVLLAKLIVEVIGDKKLQEKMAKESIKRAEKFSWEKTATETMRLFNNLVEK